MVSSLLADRPEVAEAIFDQLSDALFLYDTSLQIVGVNKSAQHLFGISAEEMIGKHCQELFRQSDSPPSGDGTHTQDESSWLASGTMSVHTNQGRERMAVFRTLQLLDDAGTLKGMVARVKGITEEAPPAKPHIIAESRAMLDLLDLVRRVAISEATSILIEGENGTGKDLIAKALHYQSLRQAKPFVAINCASIPATLLESELFGHEKGAFTDARARKVGLFELADKGTVFLDEIGELPYSIQAKLLRVLESQSFRHLGGLQDITMNVRIITATNKNLSAAVNQGAFQKALYYRLNVIQLSVPPLRERPQDILPLAFFFTDHYNQKFKRHIDGISVQAENLLLRHNWPGNVRELRNAIERAVIFEDLANIQPSSLPIAVYPVHSSVAAAARLNEFSAHGGAMSLVQQERRLLVQALEKTGGNQSRSARLLGITRDKLRYKMKKFQLRA